MRECVICYKYHCDVSVSLLRSMRYIIVRLSHEFEQKHVCTYKNFVNALIEYLVNVIVWWTQLKYGWSTQYKYICT